MECDVDVIVIGGGSNGSGVSRDLAKRGVKVMMVEKGDFARGATGGSSGMIHGGPRYLLNDTKTTEHSCLDSGYIQNIAPHLLFRIPFLVPVLSDDAFGRFGPLLYDVFFSIYDRYSPLKNGLPHARLSVQELLDIEPGLKGDFYGAVAFDEWGIDCNRLCLLNALDAEEHGAEIRTYTEVVDIIQDESGKVLGVKVRRAGEQATEDIFARYVLNCSGPWAAEMAGLASGGVRLRPGKGIHLIYEKRLTNFSITCNAVDGRQIFIMPYLNETWIGTTDDDFYGDLDHLVAEENEIEYLIQAVERILPSIRQQRLIGTRTGVRNTVHGWGGYESDLSRRFDIVDHASLGAPNLFSLLGGKLASFRVQAEDMSDVVCERLGNTTPCRTHLDPLPGGREIVPPTELCAEFGISMLAAKRLVARHGAGAEKVLGLGSESHTGFALVDPHEPVLECELRHCIRNEKVVRLGDLMGRCRLAMGADQGMHGGLRAAQILAEERGLSVADERDALIDLLSRRWQSARPILKGAQLAQAELLMHQYTGLWRAPTLYPHT